MKPHEERVVTEKAELDEKRGKLNEFLLTNPIYGTLPDAEQKRLLRQYDAMTEYSTVLRERIDAFPKE